VSVEKFARKTQGSHRIFGRVATGSVGQQRVFRRWQDLQQAGFAGILAYIAAPDRDGDDPGTAGFNGRFGFGKILVFAGSYQQPGCVALACDD